MRNRLRITLFGGVLVAATLAAATSAVADGDHAHGGGAAARCERELTEAQLRMNTQFVDRDLEPFLRNYHQDATFILFDGRIFPTTPAIRGYYTGLFANRAWKATFAVSKKVVNGCASAVVIEDATFDIPAVGYHLRYWGTLSWVRDHGQWRVVNDQLTPVTETAAAPA
jgi:ketosteroid isomerase-like protein